MLRIYPTLICLLLLCLALRPTQAQLAQTLRLEIPSDPSQAESFDVTPLGERGVLMTIRTGGFLDNTPALFSFKRYDINFKPLWQTTFKQDIKYRPILTYDNEQYAYHLFREYDTNKFQFVRLRLDDGICRNI